MCNPLMLVAASATMSVANSVNQGNAQKAAYDAQAANEDYQARVDQDNALAQAQQIRREGQAARGQTIVSSAASGVKIGQGSAGDAERQVLQNAETDAGLAILSGTRSARTRAIDASNLRSSGRAARSAGYVNAFSSLLSAGAQGLSASGFRANGPGFSGTQAPAPIIDKSWRG